MVICTVKPNIVAQSLVETGTFRKQLLHQLPKFRVPSGTRVQPIAAVPPVELEAIVSSPSHVPSEASLRGQPKAAVPTCRATTCRLICKPTHS